MTRRRHAQLTIAQAVLFGLVVKPEELMDADLRQIDGWLEDEQLVDKVMELMRRRRPNSSRRGRYSTPAEVVLRMLVLRHLRNWSYQSLEREVNGSLVYRQFCRIGADKVPDAKTLIRLGQLVDGPALRELFERITQLMAPLTSSGRKMRVDTTVLEAPIHYPTDSALCEDVVRVLGRLMSRLSGIGVKLSFYLRNVRLIVSRRIGEIAAASRRRGEKAKAAMVKPYRGLIRVTGRLTRQAAVALRDARKQADKLGRAAPAELANLIAQLEATLPRAQQVVRQTRARVLRGVTTTPGKIVSIFAPWAQIIRKGKIRKPTEFGALIKVQESDGGLVTDICTVQGTADQPLLVPSAKRHIEVFGRPPDLVSADRGFYSAEGEEGLKKLGVRRVVVPKPGHRSEKRQRLERQRWYRRGRAWRAGGEGRISFLKRSFGMDRARYKGPTAAPRTALWAGIAHNLTVAARSKRRQR
jgi:IS5 family transposase